MNIVFSRDFHEMNWLRPDYAYAEVRIANPHGRASAGDLSAKVVTERNGDEVRTSVVITNVGPSAYFTKIGDIGITLPIEDRYDAGVDHGTQRSNAHVFCGGTSSYVLALRMNGDAPHLGLVLTEGSLAAYSIERDVGQSSNDRGCFILHPSPAVLQPGEELRIAWTIFPCEGSEDFFAQAAVRSRFVRAEWDRYVLFAGESATISIHPSFNAGSVKVGSSPAERQIDGSYSFRLETPLIGEHVLDVHVDDCTVRTRILVKLPFDKLVERRVDFIARRQQYDGPVVTLVGAFLTYDNEEEHTYYNRVNDYNGGRERCGMGVLLANYLGAVQDGLVAVSDPAVVGRVRIALLRYVDFVRRELVDEITGEVFNDVGRNGSEQRLYNIPWFISFYLALYALDDDLEHLRIAFRIQQYFYASGGASMYPLRLPVIALVEALDRAGLIEERDEARKSFLAHARRMATTGRRYPPHEVNYEQSIVAPGADVTLQAYLLCGDPDLLASGLTQVHILEQFNGMQPDHHLHEVAIRHWDGYWFGKRQTFGDTFPHYWSGLSGNVFALVARITGDAVYAQRADDSIRGVLSLIHDDGRASCAYVFPYSVNGVRADYADPYANDQDWALVFALKLFCRTPVLA